jgi:hypothetical protein
MVGAWRGRRPDVSIPPSAEKPLDQRGYFTVPWRRWLESLGKLTSQADLEAAVAALQAQIDEIEGAGATRVAGQFSVTALGDETIYISLLNDTEEPGPTYYYGTGPDGLKGFYPIADAVEAATDELTKDVDPDTGVTTFGLADVAPAAGGALQRYGFDTKGRRTQQQAATTDDLAEGATNLYFTVERAQDAVGSIFESGGDVRLIYKDTINAIAAILSDEVKDSLALADSSVQSVVAGTNVTVDDTDPRNPIVSATPGGGGGVSSVVAGAGIDVDASDPANPEVALDAASAASLALADSATQPGDNVSSLANDADYISDAPSDGTTYGRKDGAWEPVAGVGGATVGGIGISIGTYNAAASDLSAGAEFSSVADSGYELTGEWFAWCYPSGSIELDLWADAFSSIPTVADSVTGGSPPAISSNTFATGTFPGGPISIDQADTLIAHVNSASGVKWAKFLFVGNRT